MINLYKMQQNIANNTQESYKKLIYNTCIIRSLLQTAAITSLEVVREESPEIEDGESLVSLIKRFDRPNDSLPFEILEITTRIIRAYIYDKYNMGWFERTNKYSASLGKELIDWISNCRNSKLGHGNLSEKDADLWASKTSTLLEQCLLCLKDSIPNAKQDALISEINETKTQITTPLMQNNTPITIKQISSKNGTWKMRYQPLSLYDSPEMTASLPKDTIFEKTSKAHPRKFRSNTIDQNKKTHLITHNIPPRQTSCFVGRSDELSQLYEWIDDEEEKYCLIYGDGGVGKTTIALEFLNQVLEGEHTFKEAPPRIISYFSAKKTQWTENGIVHIKSISESVESCVRDILFATNDNNYLEKSAYSNQGNDLITMVSSELGKKNISRNEVLLVIDNTETLAISQKDTKELTDFIKQIGKRVGRILMTSRRREKLAFTPIEVNPLPEQQCIELMKSLAIEYNARPIIDAGESKLRKTAKILGNKPVLLDALVKYISKTSGGIDSAVENMLKRDNDQLSEFLYEDAWSRITESQQDIFLTLVSMTVPLNSSSIADVCSQLEVQHMEFQDALNETYFATVMDYQSHYDIEIVDMARRFFQRKMQDIDENKVMRIRSIADFADKKAIKRNKTEAEYKGDRVANAFRTELAKEAKISADKGDIKNAELCYQLAIEEDPTNAALHDRFAWFLLHIIQSPERAIEFALKATSLDAKSPDASLTLALCHYRLNDLENGDKEIENANKKGKPISLCYLRKAIARFHTSKTTPPSTSTLDLLEQAARLIKLAKYNLNSKDPYYQKNFDLTQKYEALIYRRLSEVKIRLSLRKP